MTIILDEPPMFENLLRMFWSAVEAVLVSPEPIILQQSNQHSNSGAVIWRKNLNVFTFFGQPLDFTLTLEKTPHLPSNHVSISHDSYSSSELFSPIFFTHFLPLVPYILRC